jgi:hypothetical protein
MDKFRDWTPTLLGLGSIIFSAGIVYSEIGTLNTNMKIWGEDFKAHLEKEANYKIDLEKRLGDIHRESVSHAK